MTDNPPGVVRRRRVASPAEGPADDLARELAQETDLLNADFAAAEAAIAALHLGVYGQVEVIRTGGQDESPDIWYLSFQKDGNDWRLKAEQWDQELPPDSAITMPISSAPRFVRKLAANKLPALLAALRNAAKIEIEQVKAARGTIRGFLDSIEQGEPL